MPSDLRRLACLMFADMVGFGAQAQNDEALALELLDQQRKLVEPLFAEHGGTTVKSMGDGYLVQFPSAVDAARCAVAIQKAIRLRNEPLPPERRFELRIGLHSATWSSAATTSSAPRLTRPWPRGSSSASGIGRERRSPSAAPSS